MNNKEKIRMKLREIITGHFLQFYRDRSGIGYWDFDVEHDEREPPINMQIVRDWGDYLVELGCYYGWNKKYYGKNNDDIDHSEYVPIEHPYYLHWRNSRDIWVPNELALKIVTLGSLQ